MFSMKSAQLQSADGLFVAIRRRRAFSVLILLQRGVAPGGELAEVGHRVESGAGIAEFAQDGGFDLRGHHLRVGAIAV